MPRGENKDADAACNAACDVKGSVVVFEQPKVQPPCGMVCAVKRAISRDNVGDTRPAGDGNTGVAADDDVVLDDDKDDWLGVPLIMGNRRRGRPRKPRPVEAKKRGAVLDAVDTSFACLQRSIQLEPDSRLPVNCTDCW